MNPGHDVICDFLDGEPFQPRALGEALADPAGRDLLIDLLVLRYAAQSDDAAVAAVPAAVRRDRWPLVAAAAVLVGLLGGYQLGQWRLVADAPRPPDATRVVQVQWQNVPSEEAR